MEEFYEYIREEFKYGGLGQSLEEAFNLYDYLKKTNSVDGDIVEVGVYEGGTAKILEKYRIKDKKLFLFDTFEGLKDCTPSDGTNLHNGMMNTNAYDLVCGLFKNSINIEVVKGYFPESTNGLKLNSFSFVHLDVDTYQSTLNSLRFVYDKVTKGGVIIVHDYMNNPHTPGVSKAVDEFLENKKEKIIIPVKTKTQGIIVKL